MNGAAIVRAILLVMAMIGGTPQALPAAAPCSASAAFTVRERRQQDVGRAVTAAAVLQKLKDRMGTSIVDVRGAGAFDQFRIPGSINGPLHVVKTRSFLKTKQFILVDEGCRYEFLAKECRKLVDAGFPCFVSRPWGGYCLAMVLTCPSA